MWCGNRRESFNIQSHWRTGIANGQQQYLFRFCPSENRPVVVSGTLRLPPPGLKSTRLCDQTSINAHPRSLHHLCLFHFDKVIILPTCCLTVETDHVIGVEPSSLSTSIVSLISATSSLSRTVSSEYYSFPTQVLHIQLTPRIPTMSRRRDRGFVERLGLWSPNPSTPRIAPSAYVTIARIFEQVYRVMLDEIEEDILRCVQPEDESHPQPFSTSRFINLRTHKDSESYFEDVRKGISHISSDTDTFAY